MRLFLVIPITSPQKTFDISIVAVEKWVRAEVTFGNQNFISFLLSELNKYFSSGFLWRWSSCFCFQYKLEHELQLSLRNSIQLYILYVQAGYIAECCSSQLTRLESVYVYWQIPAAIKFYFQSDRRPGSILSKGKNSSNIPHNRQMAPCNDLGG